MNEFQRQSNGRWALITGASAGIGKAFATVFARNGFNLVLVARREEKLKNIAEQMEKSFAIRTKVLVSDLADPVSPHMWSQAEDVAEQGYQAVMKGKVFCIPGGFYKVLTVMMGFFPKSFKSWVGKRSQ